MGNVLGHASATGGILDAEAIEDDLKWLTVSATNACAVS